jgi:hypothetical protein
LLAILNEKLRDIAHPKVWRLINGMERQAIFMPVKAVKKKFLTLLPCIVPDKDCSFILWMRMDFSLMDLSLSICLPFPLNLSDN